MFKLNLYPEARARVTPDELVERMRKDIEIELVRSPDRDEVTSFNIYYSSHNRELAQQVTAELTNLFINENLEVRQQQSENTTRFLEKQLEAYSQSQTALLGQLMTAQEAERRRLSMDIHDGPLQSLGVSLLALDRAIRREARR